MPPIECDISRHLNIRPCRVRSDCDFADVVIYTQLPQSQPILSTSFCRNYATLINTKPRSAIQLRQKCIRSETDPTDLPSSDSTTSPAKTEKIQVPTKTSSDQFEFRHQVTIRYVQVPPIVLVPQFRQSLSSAVPPNFEFRSSATSMSSADPPPNSYAPVPQFRSCRSRSASRISECNPPN